MICPKCGEESFARKKTLTDGWKVTGTVEVCALCGAEWSSDGGHAASETKKAEDAKRAKLAALLGGEMPEQVTLAGKEDRRFCRNCVHFLVHPFKTVCETTDETVDPMGECERFEFKAEKR